MTINMLAVGVVLAGQLAPPPGASQYETAIQFPAVDTRSEISYSLGRDLIIQIRRAVDAHGNHFGWDLAVVDRRIAGSPNFFYECLCGHGPRPHDLFAWHFAENYYPAERILPVYGYPYEIRVLCEGCQVAGGTGTEAHFVSGSVEITWRRLPKSNPRQVRVTAFR